MASNVSAICCASYDREPLKSRCSMKWETPARSAFSSREPAPIQKPIATDRTWSSRSEMTRSPESSSLKTYFCISEDRNATPPPVRAAFAALRTLSPLAIAAAAATATVAAPPPPPPPAPPPAAPSPGPVLLRRPRRCVLRPLDQLLRLDHVPVLVLG